MELYQIIATCDNYEGEGNPRTFDRTPENFKGVKITQKFNWINPIGYTPTFAVDTMKIILADKAWLDAIFDLYGLESIVDIAIYKLNSTATAYELKSTFAVDFESYEKQDHFSEFSLKSISCIDDYNQTKSTARNFTGATELSLPTTQNFINYVSVKKLLGVVNEDHTGYLELTENETSKVYNDDTAIDDIYEKMAYQFDRGEAGAADLAYRSSGNLLVSFSSAPSGVDIYVKLYKNDYSNPVATIATAPLTALSTSETIEFDVKKVVIRDFAYDDLNFLFVGVELSNTGMTITDISGEFSLEMYVRTEIEANQYDRSIYYLTAEAILDEIFNDQATIEASLKTIGVTSAQSIMKKLSYMTLTPKDFLTDFCAAAGAIVNFKNDGTVEIAKISTYFTALLNVASAETITDFKNVVIGYDETLNFASVSTGMEAKKYDVMTYFNDWNKIMTFKQADREASENLNLTLTKFRSDFSGILDFVNKMSATSTDSSTDLFLFDPSFTGQSSVDGTIYDIFKPRDILTNWSQFLEFCFYNFSKDTLVVSSADNDDFNLQQEGFGQLDDYVFSTDNAKILPLKIEFSCLITDTDFTEKILKITHNSVDLYIFVTEAQTTDNLEEQKIKGNLIYFPV